MQKNVSFKSIIYHFFIFAFISIILFILFFFFLYLKDMYIPSKNRSSNHPLFGFYIIVSGSMEPTIHVNDAVLIMRKDHDNYKVNDIITFLPEDENYQGITVTHRIVDKQTVSENQSFYTTKGDNNENNDVGKISTAGIYGKVILIIPFAGNIKNIFMHPITCVVIIICFLCLVLLLFKKKKKSRN